MNQEIVFIDSDLDSDSESDQPLSLFKKQAVESNGKPLAVKPFAYSSLDESLELKHKVHPPTDTEVPVFADTEILFTDTKDEITKLDVTKDEITQDEIPRPTPASNGDLVEPLSTNITFQAIDPTADSSESIVPGDIYTEDDNNAQVLSDNLDNAHTQDIPNAISNSNESSDYSSDSSYLSVLGIPEKPVVSIPEIYRARSYLKSRGPQEFIKKYLPKTATGNDIVGALQVLGYNVRPNSLYTASLQGLIHMLRVTMDKVLRQRTKLDNFYTLDHVIEGIKKANKILVITGAGISTSLGIPDFRSSKGFYSRLGDLGLNDPQEVFDLDFFRQDPLIFYSIAHMILPPEGAYTPMHAFIQKLDQENKLLRNYTQNIDNLEENARISTEKVVQCHGSFATATCMTCKHKVPLAVVRNDILNKTPSMCPLCKKKRKKLEQADAYYEECYGVFKPDITFFHEKLPDRFHDLIAKDLDECDLLISVGTSLEVAPVADIVKHLPETVPQILINKDLIVHHEFDVSFLGYCDEAASYLSQQLGWELDHKQFNEILGEEGKNLEVIPMDYRGMYVVNNSARDAQDNTA